MNQLQNKPEMAMRAMDGLGKIRELSDWPSFHSSTFCKRMKQMTSETNIRLATASDESTIFALVNQLHESISVEEVKFKEAFPSVLRDPQHCCIVIEVDSEVVGYASGYKHVTLAASEQIAFLDEIVIKPELRGRGLGRRLMAAFEDWAGGHQCKLVALATGGARGFYEGLGYNSRAGYYKKALKAEQIAALNRMG